MTRSIIILSAGLSLLPALAGCGGGSDGPVASTPLKGTIGGQAFVAKEAIAEAPFSPTDTSRSIDVFAEAVGCNGLAMRPKYSVLLTVPWMSGYTKDFSLSLSNPSGGQTATFVIDDGGTPQNIVSTEGRVELISAPTDPMTPGKMRLRAIAGDDEVEGEIAVQVCAAP